MSVSPPLEPRPSAPALEIKSGSMTLPILRLFATELDALGRQLEQKLAQAPGFFRNAPVIIDIGELNAAGELPDFVAIADLLRQHDLHPVGVRGGQPEQQAAARRARLAIFGDVRAEQPPAPAPPRRPAPPPAPPTSAVTRLVTQPVRSGQRIYAAGGDLIVLAQVSPGAEIMADGHIHVYAPLKGRALAGVQGNLEARIFCSDLQAELIAIGGHYKISENLDESIGHRPVQVYLRDEALIIEAIQPAHP